MITLLCAALLLPGSAQPRATDAPVPGFVALPERPSSEDFGCANYSKDEWVVSSSNGGLSVSPRFDSDSEDPLPFTYEKNPDRAGNRHVVRVDDGWLVGFDAGEFGGGLWWFSSGGERSLRVRPSSKAPAHANDIYRAENVQGFAAYRGGFLVFMGLDHLGGESGRVFELVRKDGRWDLAAYAVLDASPAAWIVSDESVLVLTGSGLWRAGPGRGAQHLHPLDIGLLYPTSMAVGPDGALYAGMRRYVLRLAPTDSGWSDRWLVRSDCVHARVRHFDCECVPE